MRDYALHRAEASEATGRLSLFWGLIRNWHARRAVSRLDALDEFLKRHPSGVLPPDATLTPRTGRPWPVVLLTAFSQQGLVAQAAEAGATTG